MASSVVRSGARLETLVWDCSRLGLPLRYEYTRWKAGLPVQEPIGYSCVLSQDAWTWVKTQNQTQNQPPKQPQVHFSPARFSRTLPCEFSKADRQGGDWVTAFAIGWLVGVALFDDD